MRCPLLPVANYYVVLADALREAHGHILVNTAYATTPQRGTVVAWGPDTTELRTGDAVAWRRHAETRVTVSGAEWLLLKEEDIVCRLDPA